MNGNDQQNNTFSNGFLIKDKSGKFKKVQDDKVTDVEITSPPAPDQIAKKSPVGPPKPPVSEAPKPPPPKPSKPVFKPSPPVSSSPTAIYHIDSEDEEEIKKEVEKLKKIKEEGGAVDLNSIIDRIVRDNNLTFESDIIKNRFLKAVELRLRNIRDSLETAEILKRPKKVGGLELSDEVVSTVMSQLEEEAVNVQGEGKTIKEKVEVAPPKPPELEPKKPELAQAPPEVFRPKPKPLEPEKPPVPPMEKVEAAPQPAVQEPSIVFKEKEELPISPPLTTPPEMPQVIRQEPDKTKPQVIDIKKPSRPLGPIDELEELTVKDFRRLGSTPQEAVNKIMEKVDLLEEDSFESRYRGIKAWKNSEVNKLYLDIGKESIDTDRSISEVVSARSSERRPALTMDEFKAVNDLNYKLRF